MLALYAVTMGLGALLLFLVQPMFAKMALPFLGGSPAVWNIAMVFFQAALLAGYLYAHLGHRWLRPKPQALLHLLLLAAAFGILPIAVAADLQPPAGDPVAIWLLGVLAMSVGLPFFALSATAPLLQSWFAQTGHRDAANPYILYAVSNFGAILALLAYPILVEPALTLGQQSLAWAVGFVLLALLIAACAWFLLLRYQPLGVNQAAVEKIGLSEHVSWRLRLHWLSLAFVPSALLLAVTQYITTDIASAPMFWVMPLILYLGTFVIVFSRRPVISHRIAMFIAVPAAIALALTFSWRGHFALPAHLIVFFFLTLVCHGELANRRPAPSRLTEFYLWMSLGGVLGGAFTALLAPLLFNTIVEYPLAIVAACFLRPRKDFTDLRWLEVLPFIILLVLLPLSRLVGYNGGYSDQTWFLGYIILAALLCTACGRRPLVFGAAIAIVLSVGLFDGSMGVIAEYRSYFGVSRILGFGEGKAKRYLFRHGTTLHGVEFADPELRRVPLNYYHPRGPLGQVFEALAPRFKVIGGIGLGIGSVACHAPGAQWTFYEIDPMVVLIARDQNYFHYLSDCAPNARIVTGDGRLSLAREQGPDFDLLIVDAFASDAIPMHLLTREAMAVYLSHLASGGLILFHISNLQLDLSTVLADLAADAGIKAYIQRDSNGRDALHFPSTWVILARSTQNVAPLLQATGRQRWKLLESRQGRRVWTDDYSDFIRVMRIWREVF